MADSVEGVSVERLLPMESPEVLMEVFNVMIGQPWQHDVLEQSSAKAKKKRIESYIPELPPPMLMFWLSDSAAGMALQETSKNRDRGKDSIVNLAGVLNQTTLRQQDLCMRVLKSWRQNIQDEAEASRMENRSELHQLWLARHGQAGYPEWLNTLPPAQRQEIENFPRLEKLAQIDRGIGEGLGDFISRMKTTDPRAAEDLPVFTAALVLSGTVRYEYAAMLDTVSTSRMLIQPVKEGNDTILVQYAPNQAAELGYLGALVMSGCSWLAFGKTIAVLEKTKEELIDNTFARSYAQNILKFINGSEFNSLAMALITTSVEKGVPIGSERMQQLVKALKIILMSTALALLYATESSYKGKGGGITSEEFNAMLAGNKSLLNTEEKIQLAGLITDLLGQLPSSEANALLRLIGSFVDSARTLKNLTEVPSLLSNFKQGVKVNAVRG